MKVTPTQSIAPMAVLQNRSQRRRADKRRFNNSGKPAIVTVQIGPARIEKYKQVLQRIGNKTIVHWVQ